MDAQLEAVARKWRQDLADDRAVLALARAFERGGRKAALLELLVPDHLAQASSALAEVARRLWLESVSALRPKRRFPLGSKPALHRSGRFVGMLGKKTPRLLSILDLETGATKETAAQGRSDSRGGVTAFDGGFFAQADELHEVTTTGEVRATHPAEGLVLLDAAPAGDLLSLRAGDKLVIARWPSLETVIERPWKDQVLVEWGAGAIVEHAEPCAYPLDGSAPVRLAHEKVARASITLLGHGLVAHTSPSLTVADVRRGARIVIAEADEKARAFSLAADRRGLRFISDGRVVRMDMAALQDLARGSWRPPWGDRWHPVADAFLDGKPGGTDWIAGPSGERLVPFPEHRRPWRWTPDGRRLLVLAGASRDELELEEWS